MNYFIYIKSHADAPDFETEMEAPNFRNLQKQFNSRYDFDLQRADAICMDCFNRAENSIINCNH